MRYDELEWDGEHPSANHHSQALVPTGHACAMLNDWPAYRVVRHNDPAARADTYLLRCFQSPDVAIARPFAPSTRLYLGFTADLLTLACLLVHLEPAPLLPAPKE
jgi:hypothetical protein